MKCDLPGQRRGASLTIAAAGASICVLAACVVQPRNSDVRAPIGRGEITWVATRTVAVTQSPASGAATPAKPGVTAVGLSATQAPAPLARYRGPGPYNNGAILEFDVLQLNSLERMNRAFNARYPRLP